jgi:hypothetical protein
MAPIRKVASNCPVRAKTLAQHLNYFVIYLSRSYVTQSNSTGAYHGNIRKK